MLHLNVNTDAVVALTNKLDKLHKSAFPVAVRTTLNSAAFDMKKDKLLKSAKDVFEQRSPNFFKAFSRVEQAKGFDVGSMKSTVGFTEQGTKNNYAVKELEQQESGGSIPKRTFIPLPGARRGNNGLVNPRSRLSKIRMLVNMKNARGKNAGERFIKSVIFAGRGGFVVGDYKGRQILWRVNSINRNAEGGFKLTALYSVRTNRSVRVKATHFTERAALRSAMDMEKYYAEAAKKQFTKYLK